MGPAQARSRKPRCATASALAGLQASWRIVDSSAGQLASLGKEAPRGNGALRTSRFRGHRGCWPGGDLGRAAAGNGARRSACTDGHATYERIAKDERIRHFTLNAGRRSKRTPRSYHINTVNGLISRFRSFTQPFCGPASSNLAAYGRWHAARDNVGRSNRNVLKLLLVSRPHALLTPPRKSFRIVDVANKANYA